MTLRMGEAKMPTVYLLIPKTQECKGWIAENVQYEPYQCLGNGIGIEHRYIDDIINALIQEGFEVNKDFEIN